MAHLSGSVVDLIPDRLSWCSTTGVVRDSSEVHAFTIDDQLVYEPFVHDFGPLDLGKMYRFIALLQAKMHDPRYLGKKIVHFCSTNDAKRANAAFLICAYMVVVRRISPEKAFAPFRQVPFAFKPFRDASRGPASFPMTVVDILQGLEAAIRLRWFDFGAFDVDEYTRCQQVENGDMSWIVPGKFLAFTGPVEAPAGSHNLFTAPRDLIHTFQAKSVKMVIRLNSKQYEAEEFTKHRIKHVDMIFKDGSCPCPAIIEKFLFAAEREAGAIAVHCKAGLGRTGTLIGLYVMKHYGLTAKEFIGWSRLCRPGMVLGPQQQFLCDMQSDIMKTSALLDHVMKPMAALSLGDASAMQVASRVEAARSFTDEGQGENLLQRRYHKTAEREVFAYY